LKWIVLESEYTAVYVSVGTLFPVLSDIKALQALSLPLRQSEIVISDREILSRNRYIKTYSILFISNLQPVTNL
jgi:hypothetical protein